MKKKDIFISLVIIAAAVAGFFLLTQRSGYIRLEGEGVQLHLSGGFFSSIVLRETDEPVKVKARNYRAVLVAVSRQSEGKSYRLDSYGPFGDLSRTRVRAGETTVVKAGPPFTASTTAQQNGSTVSLGYVLIGQGGEQYPGGAITGASRLPAPAFAIVDENGDELQSGKFEYG